MQYNEIVARKQPDIEPDSPAQASTKRKGILKMLSYSLTCLTIVVFNIWGINKIREAALIAQRKKDAMEHATDNIIPKTDEHCKQFMRAG